MAGQKTATPLLGANQSASDCVTFTLVHGTRSMGWRRKVLLKPPSRKWLKSEVATRPSALPPAAPTR
ncbi:MAG: hypothetical protein U0326_18600 [Polyangiales bacterium]